MLLLRNHPKVILAAVPRHVRHLDIGASGQGAQILPAKARKEHMINQICSVRSRSCLYMSTYCRQYAFVCNKPEISQCRAHLSGNPWRPSGEERTT